VGTEREADFLWDKRKADVRDIEVVGRKGLTVRERSMKRSLMRRRFCASVSSAVGVDAFWEAFSCVLEDIAVLDLFVSKSVSSFRFVAFMVIN